MLTQESIRIEYSTVASNPPYAYAWENLTDDPATSADEKIDAYVDGVQLTPTTEYTVTPNVGSPGGTVQLVADPGIGKALVLESSNRYVQLAGYQAGTDFPASSHEGALDRNARLTQQNLQQIRRTLHITAAAAGIGQDTLEVPTPFIAQHVLQVNAAGDGLIWAPSTILQVIVDPVSGWANGKTITTVNAIDNASILKAVNAIPAEVEIHQATWRVMTTFGNSRGLTTLALGEDDIMDAWGDKISRIAGAFTNASARRRSAPYVTTAAHDVIVTAESGQFDAAGEGKVTVHWSTYIPDA